MSLNVTNAVVKYLRKKMKLDNTDASQDNILNIEKLLCNFKSITSVHTIYF